MGDKPDAMPLKQLQHCLIIPARMPKLDNMLQVQRKRRQVRGKPVVVPMQPRRKLVEERPECRPQPSRQVAELRHGLRTVEELLVVSYEPVDLHRVAEAVRRLGLPAVESRGEGQAVETGVDLDRVELGRVMLEPPLLRQARGVIDLAPVGIDPA